MLHLILPNEKHLDLFLCVLSSWSCTQRLKTSLENTLTVTSFLLQWTY